ncbi:MAG: NAD kinase [Propionibacteriaceae bacterium]
MTQKPTIVVWLHATRDDAAHAAAKFITQICERGFSCAAPPEEAAVLATHGVVCEQLPTDTAELAVIFGGDGTILRAAEWALERNVPLLGVNMGHVGFLAELERSDIDTLVEAVAERKYTVEKRGAIYAVVTDSAGKQLWTSHAVNEISVEKSTRERMLEILVSIDGLALSRWGCDGVLVATPTGSTAYAFSAGGPVVWPNVEAMLVVPVSAHALFSRPVVIAPDSKVTMQLVSDVTVTGAISADGRRTSVLPAGACVEISRSCYSLLLARLSEQPFTSRLVRKFGLQVAGFRGTGNEDRR